MLLPVAPSGCPDLDPKRSSAISFSMVASSSAIKASSASGSSPSVSAISVGWGGADNAPAEVGISASGRCLDIFLKTIKDRRLFSIKLIYCNNSLFPHMFLGFWVGHPTNNDHAANSDHSIPFNLAASLNLTSNSPLLILALRVVLNLPLRKESLEAQRVSQGNGPLYMREVENRTMFSLVVIICWGTQFVGSSNPQVRPWYLIGSKNF